MSFNNAYEDFKKYVLKRHKKQGFITITEAFNNHILPYFENKEINKLTKLDIIDWQNKILDKNYSNNFNAKLYYAFSQFTKYCVCCSYLEENIVSEVGPLTTIGKLLLLRILELGRYASVAFIYCFVP